MRKSSWAVAAVAAVAAGLYEGVFLGSAPFPFYLFHPVLPACVLLFMLNRRAASYVAAGLAASIIDLMSASPAGWVTLRWLAVLLIIDLLSESVATNRSVYAALALVGFARLLDRVFEQALSWLAGSFLHQTLVFESWYWWLGVAAVDQAGTALVFVALTLFTKRFVIVVNPRQVKYE